MILARNKKRGGRSGKGKTKQGREDNETGRRGESRLQINY